MAATVISTDDNNNTIRTRAHWWQQLNPFTATPQQRSSIPPYLCSFVLPQHSVACGVLRTCQHSKVLQVGLAVLPKSWRLDGYHLNASAQLIDDESGQRLCSSGGRCTLGGGEREGREGGRECGGRGGQRSTTNKSHTNKQLPTPLAPHSVSVHAPMGDALRLDNRPARTSLSTSSATMTRGRCTCTTFSSTGRMDASLWAWTGGKGSQGGQGAQLVWRMAYIRGRGSRWGEELGQGVMPRGTIHCNPFICNTL